MNDNDAFLNAARQLIAAGRYIDSKGWVPATSGNFSARLPDGTIAITVSGQHKGRLQLDDIMLIDGDAIALDGKIPSAETVLENYELLKALHGITTHESRVVVPIFANDQNIPHLAECVEQYLDQHAVCYAYIIAGHGLYTWGSSMQETLRHLEALDFLFDCELRLHGVN